MSLRTDHLIFIDDDFPTNRYHEIVLEDAAVSQEGKFFSSPVKALEYFKGLAEHSKPVLPQCIFLDINMPMYNGFELLDRLLQLSFNDFPPVYMLTTSSNPMDVEKAKEYEVIKAFFEKPLTEELLQKVLNKPLGVA